MKTTIAAAGLLCRVLLATLLLFALSPLARAQVDTGVLARADGKATVTATYRSYNRATKVAAYDVTANVSAALAGPVYVVLEGLTGAGVTVANAAGTTTSGLAYYQLSAGNVAAGAALTASVLLNNPSNVRVSFTPVVYATPGLATVPNVVGQPEGSARAALQGAGLTATTNHANHATVAAGLVISQQPGGGTQVSPGSAVAIVISDGPLLSAVPNVVGQAEAAAVAALQGAGLTATTSHANHATVAAGLVISQQPAGGAQVTPGSAVAIVISDGPLLSAVPSVVGQTEAAAVATLQGAGLTATTSHAHHATVPVGRVISQQPAAGAQVAAGSAVAIVISDGPTLVAVPDVVSQTEASATAALQSAGLTATTSHANHATVVAGRVISQQPAAGAQVAAGSAVGIVISDGPVGGPLSILITSPSTLLTVGSTPIEVQGTVDNVSGPLTLTVNGAPVDVGAGGAFSASVALQEGHNAIVARAVTAAAEAAATISVSLDLTPPYITIESPADGSVVTTKFIAVTGLINDIVRGTVSDGQANVTVNGTAAAVANRTYLAENVELVEGLNTLTIRGADQVGNTNTVTTSVTYKVPAAKHIELVSGQSQRARIRATLAQSLQVKLFDELGDPVVDKAVVFRVTEGDGEVGFGSSSQGQAVLIKTDTNGVASTTMLLGSRAGNGNNRVTAKSVGFEGQVEFYASADPNPADKVSVHSGNTQRGGLNQPLPLPFVVNVTDDGSNVIAGAQVEFQVTTGGGKFQNGSPTYLATTDSDGRANATLTLGDEAGLDVHRVTATLAGSQLYAGFTASALVSGDPGQTSISGVVLDNQDQPLPNVTVRVDGTTREAKTNPQGQFKVTEVPVGPVHLIVDGATTTAPGEWPTLPYNIVTVAGADNPLAAPIYMVKLDTENAVWVGKEDKVITHPDMPGFALTVLKNSVTFPNGAREGYVSVTAVNASKIPMAPPNGMQPQLIVTIQPVGARFDPPAPLQMPNVDGHAPGAQVEMYSFDHDLEEFVAIGLGRVSLDGTVIASSPGVGVVKAGWHCGSQPTGGGCAASPGECQACDGNCNIVAAPGNITNTAGDCRVRSCSGTSPTEANDDSDKPLASAAPENFCKTCSGGAIVPDMGKNGQVVGTNKCLACKDGGVEELDVDETVTTLSYTYGFPSESIKKINDELENLTKFGILAKVSGPSIAGQIQSSECCEPTQGVANKLSGSVNGNLIGFNVKGKVWPLGPIPTWDPPAVDIGLFSLDFKAQFIGGIFLGVDLSAAGLVGYKKDPCSDVPADRDGCFNAEVGVNLTPKISAELGGEGSLNYDCLFLCDETTVSVSLSFIFGELSWPITITGVSYNKESCAAGLAGGNMQANPVDFKISTRVSGSYQKAGEASQTIDLTFDFVSCSISLSGATCNL